MVNYVFVAAGQCGNQLAYDLLDNLFMHSRSAYHLGSLIHHNVDSYNPFTDGDDSSAALFESVFRGDSSYYARAVCLDTEPKVIDHCLERSQSPRSLWHYDPRSILYRHGGAGNNWALGYSMASGEFLEKSLECIRRELEHCDTESGLVFLHSLAGGTGSGLGTHITEACEDEFPSSCRANIVIAPHHFGEVVVQHYNALLCLSKIHQSSHGIIMFENEIAQMLCKEMHGIEKPLLRDLNHVISSNLLSLFLPKMMPMNDNFSQNISPSRKDATAYHPEEPRTSGYRSHRNLFDDLAFLCSHPGFRFCQVRLTPQTSKKSIDYTYDSWTALLKAIQRMQLSGTPLERHVRYEVKSMLNRKDQALEEIGVNSSPSNLNMGNNGEVNNLNKALASIVTFHGEKAYQACKNVLENSNFDNKTDCSPSHNNICLENPSVTAYSKLTTRTKGTIFNAGDNNLQLYDEFYNSHSDMLSTVNMNPVQCHVSPFLVNKYKRSTTVLSNDQAILPILQRSVLKSQDMFEVGAYIHQYTTNGLEQSDFYEAFRSIGAIVHNYSSL